MRNLKGVLIGALAFGTIAMAAEPASAMPVQTMDGAAISSTPGVSGVEKVWWRGYGWRRGWRRPVYGYGWRRHYYGYGWRRGWRRW